MLSYSCNIKRSRYSANNTNELNNSIISLQKYLLQNGKMFIFFYLTTRNRTQEEHASFEE